MRESTILVQNLRGEQNPTDIKKLRNCHGWARLPGHPNPEAIRCSLLLTGALLSCTLP